MSTTNSKFLVKNGLAVAGSTGAIDVINTSGQWIGATGALHGATGVAGATGVSGASGVAGVAGATGTSGDRYLTTSSTSFTLADTGSQTVTVDTGLAYSANQTIILTYDASNHQHGRVTSYNSGTGSLVFDKYDFQGSGTYASWTVNLDGAVGAQGASGVQGASGANASTTWSIKTTTYTAVAGDLIVADTTAGAFTITLPATPSTGASISIADGGNWATNNLTIARNGSTIEGLAENLVVDIGNIILTLVYDGTTWEPFASVSPIGASGAIGLTGATGVDGASGAAGANGATGTVNLFTAQFGPQTAATGATGYVQVLGTLEVGPQIAATGATGWIRASGTITANAASITTNASFGLVTVGTGVTPGATGSISTRTLGATGVTTNTLSSNSATITTNTASGTITVGTGATGATGSINASGDLNVGGNAVVTGNLTVNGTTTTVNSTTITVDDVNIELGSVASPTDVTAAGGGVTLKGATDKTLIWQATATTGGTNTGYWNATENWNLSGTNKAYFINGVSVLNQNTLGSGITASSLTSLGTIATLSAGTIGATGVTTNTLNATTIGVTTPGGISSTSVNAGGATGVLGATGTVTGVTLVSTVATGTAPFTVSSTTNVANLNASSLSGNTFASPGNIGTTTPGGLTGTGLNIGGATGVLGATGTITASSSATATAFIPTGSTVPTNGIYLPAANSVGFSTATSEAMRIISTGNVGIGTTNPGSFKLELVQGTGANNVDMLGVVAKNTGGTFQRLRFIGNDLDSTPVFSINTDGPSIRLNPNGVERMRITTDGTVIIGNGETSATPAAALLKATDGSGTNITGAALTLHGGRGTGTGAGGALIFQTAPTGTSGSAINAGVERMRIDSTGNVRVEKAARGTVLTDNDLSFDMNASSNFKCTPTALGTLTFTNITSGQSGFILLVNTGGYAISAAATTEVSSTTLTTISTAGTYLLSYFSDGTNVFVTNSGALA